MHPEPTAVIAHLSDTHLLAGGARLADLVDTEAHLRATVERLRIAAPDADAIVVSGDVADRGEPEAYALAREILEPVATQLGAPIVWAAGNHDDRPQMRAALGLAGDPLDSVDSVLEVGQLRIVTLDTSLPGWHHGGFDEGQAEWLAAALALEVGEVALHRRVEPHAQSAFLLKRSIRSAGVSCSTCSTTWAGSVSRESCGNAGRTVCEMASG